MPHPKRVALVTGSGTGVGRAAATRFSQLGYSVVVNYSRSQNEAEETSEIIRQNGSDCLCVQCDVSDETAVETMVQKIDSQYGRLDVLVNNAAMTYFVAGDDLAAMSEEKWDRILAVNTKGPFFCIKAAAALLCQGEGGAVVNVSSVAGQTGSGSCIAYSASKGALNTLTKTFAKILAPQVRVNAVLPGPIDSRWIREGDNDWELSDMTRNYPIPRASTPDEIADAIVFLAANTSMTTGQLLCVDGGQTL